jgi:hypothetical protein
MNNQETVRNFMKSLDELVSSKVGDAEGAPLSDAVVLQYAYINKHGITVAVVLGVVSYEETTGGTTTLKMFKEVNLAGAEKHILDRLEEDSDVNEGVELKCKVGQVSLAVVSKIKSKDKTNKLILKEIKSISFRLESVLNGDPDSAIEHIKDTLDNALEFIQQKG